MAPPQPPVAAPVEPSVQSPVGPQPLNAAPAPVLVPAPTTTPAVTARPRVSRAPWVVASVAVVVALASIVALVLHEPAALAAGGGQGAAAPTASTGTSPSSIPSDQSQATVGDHGFATPEETVKYVVEHLAAGDAARASEAFAIDHMVAGYSYRAQAERLNAVTPSAWLPATSDGFRAIDEGLRRGDAARQLQTFVQHAIAPQHDFTLTISPADSSTIDGLESALAPQGLASLSLVRLDALQQPTGSRYALNLAKMSAMYGPDEAREMTFLCHTSQGTELGGVTLLRYGNSWYVWYLASQLAGLSSGELQPMSEQDYLARVAQLQAVVNPTNG